MNQGKILYITGIGEFPHFFLYSGDEPGIATQHNNQRQQFTKRICLMKFEYDEKPVFRVVSDHVAKLVSFPLLQGKSGNVSVLVC